MAIPEKKKPFLSSALWPGVVLGLLSVIPVVNYGNFFCCMWIIGGGVLATIIFKSENKSVTSGEGAIVGFIAGMIGAVVVAIGNGILWFFFHENYLANLKEVIDTGSFDPEMIDTVAGMINNPTLLIIFSLIGALIMNAIFSTFGGFLAASIMQKKERKRIESGS